MMFLNNFPNIERKEEKLKTNNNKRKMKKIAFLAIAAISALGFGSCGNSTPKADLNNELDTLSYAIGMAQSNGLAEYLVQSMGVDSVYADEFIKGLNEGVSAGDDKKKAAYYAGIQIGQQISTRMVKGINNEIFGEDSTKTISLKNFMAGFVNGYTGKGGLMTIDEAGVKAQTMMEKVKAQVMEEQYGDNKKAGEDFLAKNKNAEGVKTLPSGVQYKVLVEGKGEIPADSSTVKVNYEGKLIDGTVFDSSYERGEPTTLRANMVISGWTEVLTKMPVGSTWMVYIPQDKAYGARKAGKIDPFSALIFKIELVGIEK